MLVEAFRRYPGDHTKAAAIAQCDPRTAEKAWSIGLPYPWAATPIKSIIHEEQEVARARRQVEAEAVHDAVKAQVMAELGPQAAGGTPGAAAAQPAQARPRPGEQREAAKNDAASARAAEASMVRFARGNTIGLLAVNAKLVKASTKLAEAVALKLADANYTTKVDPADAVKLFRDLAALSRSAVLAADAVVDMERKLLGDPGAVGEDMTPEEAVREIEEAQKAMERAKEHGLQVLQGGKR